MTHHDLDEFVEWVAKASVEELDRWLAAHRPTFVDNAVAVKAEQRAGIVTGSRKVSRREARRIKQQWERQVRTASQDRYGLATFDASTQDAYRDMTRSELLDLATQATELARERMRREPPSAKDVQEAKELLLAAEAHRREANRRYPQPPAMDRRAVTDGSVREVECYKCGELHELGAALTCTNKPQSQRKQLKHLKAQFDDARRRRDEAVQRCVDLGLLEVNRPPDPGRSEQR